MWANYVSNSWTQGINYFASGQFNNQLQTTASDLNSASANNPYLALTVQPAQNSINQAANGDPSGFATQIALLAATGGVYNSGSGGVNGPGTWTSVNESMSAQSAAYQARITGADTGTAYVVNGVKFDGYQNGVLLDAKANYGQFVDNTTGQFADWFTGQNKMVTQAQNQVTAANGNPIQWVFQEESAANATRTLLNDKQISGIEVVHAP